MSEIIKINNIKKIYGKGESKVCALNGVSLNIKKGEMISIMGASGSGKSTLMNIIGLLDDATSGDYELNGKSVSQYGEKQKCRLRNSVFGFVVQDFALVDLYTVKQNVSIPFTYADEKISNSEKEKIIDTLLKKLKIYDKKNTLVNQLSGGQRQRVAIARALVRNPDIILADEPTGALDSKTSAELMELFIDLNESGKTVIIITHDSKIANYCKRKIEILDGMIV